MKFVVNKPVQINPRYLNVYCGSRIYPEDICFDENVFETMDEIFEKYPQLFGNCNGHRELMLRIDIENGKVINWPKDINGDFISVKVVDEGTYELLDSELNSLCKYEGYVPSCLQIEEEGYGDYFEFLINDDGYINDWSFTQKDVNELFEVGQD